MAKFWPFICIRTQDKANWGYFFTWIEDKIAHYLPSLWWTLAPPQVAQTLKENMFRKPHSILYLGFERYFAGVNIEKLISILKKLAKVSIFGNIHGHVLMTRDTLSVEISSVENFVGKKYSSAKTFVTFCRRNFLAIRYLKNVRFLEKLMVETQ